jgi:hypothetical protein
MLDDSNDNRGSQLEFWWKFWCRWSNLIG